MSKIQPVCVDFETFGIENRPTYPPKPVGISIKWPGKPAHYYAFGHPTENNCTEAEAKRAARAAWSHHGGILCQNAKFDVDVAEVHWGLKVPKWSAIHDTMFLIFLDDPNQPNFSLKPSSERLLKLPPEEQDAVGEWLVKHQPVRGVKISKSKSSPHYFGRYIAYAPGGLVGKYANGDTARTEKLFKLLLPKTIKRGMLGAYDRERRLMPILLGMERQGLPVAHAKLRDDVKSYTKWLERINAWVEKRLKLDVGEINLDSGEQLFEAMLKARVVDRKRAPLTPTGKFQTNKEALLTCVTDKQLLAVLKYRAQLRTCLNTFMLPWLTTADLVAASKEQSAELKALRKEGKSLIFTNWNQVKGDARGGGNAGARTGRLSSTPNFQNIPKEFSPIFAHDEAKLPRAERKGLPTCPLKGLPPLPNVRAYVVPFSGETFVDRDYCFGPGTDVLTRRGFVRFEDLTKSDQLAQWKAGVVTYAQPIELQRSYFDGDLVHIIGDRSADLLVTPNHRCLVKHETRGFEFVRADEFKPSNAKQPHAGVYEGSEVANPDALALAAALQADATVKPASVCWKMKKRRKLTRLRTLLNRLGLPFEEKPTTDGQRTIRIPRADAAHVVRGWLDLENGKTFQRSLLEVRSAERLAFLRELAHWDGTTQGEGAWRYFTTNVQNGLLVQELAAVTGLRSNTNVKKLKSGKSFIDVSMRLNSLTYTDGYKVKRVKYSGVVHCATMPHGTLIIRRGRRVVVTSNSQQEPRILAHFDGGALLKSYLANPWIDFHDFAKAELEKMGLHYSRKAVKTVNLGLIYGMGLGTLAERLGVEVEEAKKLKGAVLRLYPGLKEMYSEAKRRAAANEPVRTWGGREYYCEPPKVVDGRYRTYDYKLVNVLIQGSAADCTKEAIIRFNEKRSESDKLLLNVHDQLTVSVPHKRAVAAMEVLRKTMESIEFDVPMLSEGSMSRDNWASLRDTDKKGKPVALKAA